MHNDVSKVKYMHSDVISVQYMCSDIIKVQYIIQLFGRLLSDIWFIWQGLADIGQSVTVIPTQNHNFASNNTQSFQGLN